MWLWLEGVYSCSGHASGRMTTLEGYWGCVPKFHTFVKYLILFFIIWFYLNIYLFSYYNIKKNKKSNTWQKIFLMVRLKNPPYRTHLIYICHLRLIRGIRRRNPSSSLLSIDYFVLVKMPYSVAFRKGFFGKIPHFQRVWYIYIKCAWYGVFIFFG